MTVADFFIGLAKIINLLFSDQIQFFGIPLWTLLVGSTIFIALLKFIKGKGSGS